MPSRVPLQTVIVHRSGRRVVVPPLRAFAFTPTEAEHLDSNPGLARLPNNETLIPAGDHGPLSDPVINDDPPVRTFTALELANARAVLAAVPVALAPAQPAAASKVPLKPAAAIPLAAAAADL